MAGAVVNRVRIIELPDNPDGNRWLLAWSATDVEQHQTAMSALAAVQTMARILVEGGKPAVITSIEWEPKSKVGRAVVGAIVSTKAAR